MIGMDGIDFPELVASGAFSMVGAWIAAGRMVRVELVASRIFGVVWDGLRDYQTECSATRRNGSTSAQQISRLPEGTLRSVW